MIENEKQQQQQQQPKEMSASSRARREGRDGGFSFQITTTIIFFFSMSFFVLFMGMFISDHVKKFVLSQDFYFPQFSPSSTTTTSWPRTTSLTATPLCNYSSSLNSNSTMTTRRTRTTMKGLADWVAPKEQQLWHSMRDKELMWLASMSPLVEDYPFNRTPKVAFMFLARGRLPLQPIWERFFKGHDGLFSIYLHCPPGFNEEPSESSVFFKRRIPSQQVQWGTATMIDAERRLLANALLDFSNERFVLLSETCIPVFNFTTVYNYLINSNHSFLGSFDDPRPMGRGRYNKRMWPIVSLSDWRKGSQWFEVNRKLAIKIISDQKYYPVFREHCRPPCYMDEHYLPTLVTKLHPELNSNRSLTWVDWTTGGSHPKRFVRRDVSESLLNRIRSGFNCSYNGNYTTSICFLFARKFHPSTLEPLLRIAPTMLGFDP
ncbi:glycosyltransferase BC10-like [Telopea speciosissima]|uniref:glycosyltransferase BC10-like n=1 Tax=Telopea speciosissima TaxID=54955 RepID=UPI001CC4B793|nr:glycosyltransferase BC10-like [Telopea speciosissima]